MHKQVCIPPKLNFWIICALFLVVAVSPYLDLSISSYFYRNNCFFLSDWGFFPILRTGLPEFLILVAGIIGILWIIGKLRHKLVLGIDTKIMLFTTGSMLLGPIIIVNGIFKSFWGRARPLQITEFGGDKIFTSPLVISNQCSLDCSFM